MKMKGSFRSRLRQSNIDIRKKNDSNKSSDDDDKSKAALRWGQLSDIVHNNDKNDLRNEILTSMTMKDVHCLDILLDNNCPFTHCPEWLDHQKYSDSLLRGLRAFSTHDERLSRELFLKFSSAIISFNTVDKSSQKSGIIYRNHQQILLLLYLSLIKSETTVKDYDSYNTFMANHHNASINLDGAITMDMFIDFAVFFHKGQVLLKEIEIKMGYNIMDFIDAEDGNINEEKLEVAIRDLFASNMRKKQIGSTDFSSSILEEHIDHMLQWVLSDIKLMRATSSFFVVDLKEKVNRVCDYVYNIAKAQV